jgi:hypothetical protein
MNRDEIYGHTTRQWAFETVLQHMRKQRQPAQDAAEGCRYRFTNEDGVVLMCAAGCLIPDSRYEPSMEGRMVSEVIDDYELHDLFEYTFSLVRAMQQNHDLPAQNGLVGEEWLVSFERRMLETAGNYGLTYTAPEAA